jgi:hypothetical protein
MSPRGHDRVRTSVEAHTKGERRRRRRGGRRKVQPSQAGDGYERMQGRVRTGAGGYNECRAMKITRYVIAKHNYYLHGLCFKVKRGDDETNSSGFKSCCSSPSPCPSSTTTTRTIAAVARTAAVRLPPPRSSPSASTTWAAAAARIAAARLSRLKFERQRREQ